MCMYDIFDFQIRESDPSDPHRERSIQLLDDFKISGANGKRTLFTLIAKNSLLVHL